MVSFRKRGVLGMLEGKDYQAVRMEVPIIRAYIDRVTEFQNDAYMTGAHPMYCDILSNIRQLCPKVVCGIRRTIELRRLCV